MAFSLDRVALWGRSFAEYRQMFALTDEDLKLRILGCADGPASFNTEATTCDIAVVSVDPVYGYPDSILDFIFVAGPAKQWQAKSWVVIRSGDFPDSDETSDHRPVAAVVEVAPGK